MNDSYVSDAHVCPTVNGDAGPECAVPIDDLLDQAVAAINRGDRVAGTALGEQVLAVDGVNAPVRRHAQLEIAVAVSRTKAARSTLGGISLVISSGSPRWRLSRSCVG